MQVALLGRERQLGSSIARMVACSGASPHSPINDLGVTLLLGLDLFDNLDKINASKT